MTAHKPADVIRPADLIREEADLLAAGLELQQQGMELLLAEMRALAAMLPGEDPHLPTDAEVEAGFDNMPV
ncbi:hypothetical protein [Tabrizicola sp.]|uniref:hypothetical protein n=1 Tax=Tabrizicola sp. TaxID=2005166 RepID=UPI0027341FE7|nr:hypothetical protein [Tabrizicola sp.]MDP3195758.1 hypothetical protein [Tabrizicola sp.]